MGYVHAFDQSDSLDQMSAFVLEVENRHARDRTIN